MSSGNTSRSTRRSTTNQTVRSTTIRLVAIVCVLAAFFGLAYYAFQKHGTHGSTFSEQEAKIADLQNRLDLALADQERLQKELEAYKGQAGSDRDDTATKHGLVRLLDIDPTFEVDLRYATDDNFLGRRVYPSDAVAVLRESTALKLKKANDMFKKDGYRVKILDAYRPLHVQYIFWYFMPDTRFVADPLRGSKHNRGTSVDITLVDKDGNEIEMGTKFDDFTEKAAYDYAGHTETALKNMKYMREVMEKAGFRGISTEWWHFDDTDWQDYELLDVGFR